MFMKGIVGKDSGCGVPLWIMLQLMITDDDQPGEDVFAKHTTVEAGKLLGPC